MRYYAKQKIISSGGVFAAGEIVIGLKKTEITSLLEAGALIADEPQQVPDKKEQVPEKEAPKQQAVALIAETSQQLPDKQEHQPDNETPIKSRAVETDISSDTEPSEDDNQLELQPEENGAVDGELEDNQKNDDINQ